MDAELVILLFSNVANTMIGLFALSKDWRSRTNQVFTLLTLSLVGWTSFTYLSTVSSNPDIVLMSFRFILFFVVLQNTLFMLFVSVFGPSTIKRHRLVLNSYLIFSVITLAIGGIVGFFDDIRVSGGEIEPIPSPVIILFIIHSAASIGWGMVRLVRHFKMSHGKARMQYKFLTAAAAVLLLIAPLTNFILPVAFDIDRFVVLGPVYTFAFASLIAYAMFKHQLLDIRLLVARSVAYALLISTLAGIYVGMLLILPTLFFFDEFNENNKFFPLVAALFLVATAPLLKQWFDHISNKLFYHDAYDPQTFLDQLNKTLVANIEIGILLRHSAMVIEENLKAECHIYVKETENAPQRIMGINRLDIKPLQLELIHAEMATIKEKTVFTDELGDHYLELKNALYLNNIAVISKLVTSYSANQEATAYLLLGPKKSGSAYSKQDRRILNIITDELLIAIQNALRFEEIQTFNITLQNRINDATAKLRRSNEKLKEMDETKDEFISMASHQLRTPLTSVKGYLSMVLDGDAGKVPDDQHQLLNQAYVSAQRMVYLIADLLNVSRLKTGKFMIERTPTNLADMVESEIAQLVEVAKSHKITLNYNKPEDFPILEIDETKTRQVVMNFVDNAIYYTPGGGKIKIELRTDRSSVYFMVKDNGMGVPKSDQPHLFTKFYRARNAQKARPDGTGLGLFMAKKVITEQGGTILFESEEGKGSIFGFKFDRPKEEIKLKADE